jgi:hypothetical protein
VTQE